MDWSKSWSVSNSDIDVQINENRFVWDNIWEGGCAIKYRMLSCYNTYKSRIESTIDKNE